VAQKRRAKKKPQSLEERFATILDPWAPEVRAAAVQLVAWEKRSTKELEMAARVFRPPRKTIRQEQMIAGALAIGGGAWIVTSGARAGEVWVLKRGKLAREGFFPDWIAKRHFERASTGRWSTARLVEESKVQDILALARQILETQRKKTPPDHQACATAGELYEQLGDPIKAAQCFALGGKWIEVRRVASAAMIDDVHTATHLTHLAIASAALGELIVLPADFPRHASYASSDPKLLPMVVERLSSDEQRAFFAAVDPAIALDLFARGDETMWADRIEALKPVFDVLVGLLIADRVNVPSVSISCRAIARWAVGTQHGDLLDAIARSAALMNDTALMKECLERGRAIGWKFRSIAHVMRPLFDGVRKLAIAAALIHLDRYEDAIDLCTQAIVSGADEWSWLAYYNRGTARAALGDYRRAVEDFERVISLKPDHAFAHNNRANAYYHLGDLGHAKQSSRRSLELDPKNAPAHWVAANIAAAEGDRRRFYEEIAIALRLGARVWEHKDRIHRRYREERELADLFVKYRK